MHLSMYSLYILRLNQFAILALKQTEELGFLRRAVITVGLYLLPSLGKYVKCQTTWAGTESTLLTILNRHAVFLEAKQN